MFHIIHDVFSLCGQLTATAGTVINALVPARTRLKTVIQNISYKNSTTAHTLTALRNQTPRGSAPITLTSAAATGQAVINVSSKTITRAGAASTIAANDYVVVLQPDGSSALYVVSSVSTLAVTLTGNVSVALPAGTTVWPLGVAADHAATASFPAPVSATTNINDNVQGAAGLIASYQENEPILIQSNNATAAGFINQVNAVYIKQGA